MYKSIIAIIITYHPDVSVVAKTIRLLENSVSSILIVDNSEDGFDTTILKLYPNVRVIHNYENLGVAKAINIALHDACVNNFKYAFLLDQDSVPTDNIINYLLQGFEKYDKILISSPKIVDVDSKIDSHSIVPDFEKVFFAITSGSLIDLSYLSIAGVMDENLFIDYVDTEYCLRIHELQLHIIKCNKAILFHSVGNKSHVRILFWHIYPTNHSYLRRYYKMRNRIYVWKKYYSKNKLLVIKNIFRSLLDVFEIIAFENDKTQKILYICRGIIDGFKNKYGRITTL